MARRTKSSSPHPKGTSGRARPRSGASGRKRIRPGGNARGESGANVRFVSRGLFRVPAALKIRELVGGGGFDLVHANESACRLGRLARGRAQTHSFF